MKGENYSSMDWFACRFTLLLGPPGCGKTTFLLALAGKLNQSLKVSYPLLPSFAIHLRFSITF